MTNNQLNGKYGVLQQEQTGNPENSSGLDHEIERNKNFQNANFYTNELLKIKNKLSDQFLFIDTIYSRKGKLRKAKLAFDLNQQNIKEFKKIECTSVSQGQEKNSNILNDIHSLFNQLDNNNNNNKKSPSRSIPITDSLLNSHKNYVIINNYEDFKQGKSILNLKKEDFLKKANLYMKPKKIRSLDKENSNFLSNSDDKESHQNKQIPNLIESIRFKNKESKIFSTELNKIIENDDSKIIEENANKPIPYLKNLKTENSKILQNEESIFTSNIQNKKPTIFKIINKNRNNKISKSVIFPKINVREINLEVIPEKINIYAKIKIKDILDLAKIAKPPFK